MKKTPKAPAKTARKAAAAKPAAKKAKTSAAPKATVAPKAMAAPKAPKPAPKAAPAPKVGWSEAIRNALKEKQSGHGPGGGNVWSGKQRAGSSDPQTLRRGRTD